MSFFTSNAAENKSWETYNNNHINIDSVFLGVETPRKTQHGKTSATIPSTKVAHSLEKSFNAILTNSGCPIVSLTISNLSQIDVILVR